MQYDVLLTYAWVRSTYAASRSLEKIGLRVATTDEKRIGMCQWSNKSDFIGMYSPPLTHPSSFISDISNLLEETGARFLLPSHDETEVIAKYRDSLPSNVIIPITGYENIKKANDKAIMAEIAESIDIPIPCVLKWKNLSELENKLKSNKQEKFVVKLRRGNSSKGVFFPPNRNETLKKVSNLCDQYQLTTDRHPIVQERIEGEGWGVSCLYWEGKRIAHFTHKRLKEKIKTGGPSTLRVSESNPILEEYAFRILDQMNWHGLAMVEFKYNSNSKEAWFIEINPRLWGSIHLAISAGVDFPKLLYVTATKGEKEALKITSKQKDGVIARWYMGDIITSVSDLIQLKPIEAFKSILPRKCDSYDDIYYDDLGAFAGEFMGYFSGFIKSRSTNPEKEGMLG